MRDRKQQLIGSSSLRPILSAPFSSNPTATTYIYTLSLHDALPISSISLQDVAFPFGFFRLETSAPQAAIRTFDIERRDRKSTRLNSSHVEISYAVFCLKKKTLLTLANASSTSTYRCPFSNAISQSM